ncbi:MAG: Holliday junction branch migration protein RuvA [Bacteroidetes bacterium]|nr:Holliday junction branch migration protein RuvA [Bacteroidota bacterium]
MIGHLTGKIISKKPTQIIVDVNGVGYLVNITIPTFEKLEELGKSVSLFTYLNVKEDALALYGFSTLSEKEMFEILISVNGIGPKLAQSILSGIQVEELKDALRNANLSRIIAVPGIGRKTGERLLIELRDKIENVSDEFTGISQAEYSVRNDAVSALTSLGYNHKSAENAVRQAINSNAAAGIEEVIKEALALLNR